MYAVIQTGGKQYRVEPGKTITVEKLAGEAGAQVVFDQVLLVSSGDGGSVTVGKPLVAGAKVVFDQVLLVSSGDGGSVSVGKPLVTGAKVTGEIVEQTRGEKLVVFKFRRRKNYVRRNGHRQDVTVVKVAAINA